jgi:hypothetical protein
MKGRVRKVGGGKRSPGDGRTEEGGSKRVRI